MEKHYARKLAKRAIQSFGYCALVFVCTSIITLLAPILAVICCLVGVLGLWYLTINALVQEVARFFDKNSNYISNNH